MAVQSVCLMVYWLGSYSAEEKVLHMANQMVGQMVVWMVENLAE